MDVRCVRLLRQYPDAEDDNVIYVDEPVREMMQCEWGAKIGIRGRNDATASIQPLRPEDRDVLIARVSQKTLDEAYVEYGEQVLLFELQQTNARESVQVLGHLLFLSTCTAIKFAG